MKTGTGDRRQWELSFAWNKSKTVWVHWTFVDTLEDVERARRERPYSTIQAAPVILCGHCRTHRTADTADCPQCAYNREHLARVRAERAAL